MNKEIIAFQEKGIRKRDGMLSTIQGNVISFSDRKKLVNDIIFQVKKRWRTDWRNELLVEDQRNIEIPFVPINYQRSGDIRRPSRFFHITLHNYHYYISAKNCTAYLESYKKTDSIKQGTTVPDITIITNEPIELKWKGVISQGVLITPKTSRKFDAFFVYEHDPAIAYAGTNYALIDYSEYDIKIKGPGTFELHFVIHSDNFSPLRPSFILNMGTTLDEIQFYRKY